VAHAVGRNARRVADTGRSGVAGLAGRAAALPVRAGEARRTLAAARSARHRIRLQVAAGRRDQALLRATGFAGLASTVATAGAGRVAAATAATAATAAAAAAAAAATTAATAAGAAARGAAVRWRHHAERATLTG